MIKGLYIHLPFCKEKCPYCVFPTIQTTNLTLKEKYLEYLITQINALNPALFDTIYIGGGTPNYLSIHELKSLFEALQNFTPKEYTIELNPEFITPQLIKLLREFKINRISLGVQTFHKRGYQILKRAYHYTFIKKIVHSLRHEVTSNISLDLIFNYPTQRIKDFKADLRKALALQVFHLSVYDLIYEDNSNLTYRIKKGLLKPNDNDFSFRCFSYLLRYMKRKKYIHYEISSFAREGYEGIHNKKYWQDKPYLALGLGAASYDNIYEVTNASSLSLLYKNKQQIVKLSANDKMSRYMFMGLRLIKEGVNISAFSNKFSIDLTQKYNLTPLFEQDLLTINNGNLLLTKKGLFWANKVFMEFIE